ncbi:MAG: MFS transporter [Chloroflexota bacterium]|nr:MFS transporter [Chloroflexota bacterium]
MIQKLQRGIDAVLGFVRRQKRNYRVGVARSAANSFLMSLTSQYNGIYATGLGADSVQLGSLSSVGSAISSLIALPVGWLVDRRGVKLFFLLAILLSAGGTLLYGLAYDWHFLIVAAMLTSVSTRLIGTGCSVICADSVNNPDRFTAQNLCGTLSSIASMISPLIAACLITLSGGVNVEGIRPLYFIRFVGYGLIFLLVITQLREPREKELGQTADGLRFVDGFRQLFLKKPTLRRWIAISVLTSMAMPMF